VIQWQYFPRSTAATSLAREVVRAFETAPGIDSAGQSDPSNKILAAVAPALTSLGFSVETGKTRELKVHVPVLFGLNGRTAKSFDADAHHVAEGFVVEVEAGRGVVNNQFLKDLFQACMMHDVFYLAIAVRNTYKGRRTLRASASSSIHFMPATDSIFLCADFSSLATNQAPNHAMQLTGSACT
jgi:hypothetical protein